jgi:hypothetical protein
MATNLYKKYTESLTEEWVVPTGTGSGVLVINAQSSRPGVTLTARGDHTRSYTLPGGEVISGIQDGGVGNKNTAAVVAVDGAWLFPVTGAVAGETVAGAGTPQGTKVYRTSGGTLTLTATGNALIGEVADGRIIGTTTPIWVGKGVA